MTEWSTLPRAWWDNFYFMETGLIIQSIFVFFLLTLHHSLAIRLEKTMSTHLCPWWAMRLTCVRPWSMCSAPHWSVTPWTMPREWLLISRWWPRLSLLEVTSSTHKELWVEVSARGMHVQDDWAQQSHQTPLKLCSPQKCFWIWTYKQKCVYFWFVSFPLPGARSQSASVLSSLQELKEGQDNLMEKETQLQDTERQLASLKGTAEKYWYTHSNDFIFFTRNTKYLALSSTCSHNSQRNLKSKWTTIITSAAQYPAASFKSTGLLFYISLLEG